MVKLVERDFESFFQTPFSIRGEHSLYASPFKSDLKKMLSRKNPIFSSESDYTYFTALDGQRPVGRITAHVHRAYNDRFKDKRSYFGFFECIDNQSVANMLFNAAEEWAKTHGFTALSGNFNLTAMQEMGVMVNGYSHEPYILQSYGMPYYAKLMKSYGFSPTFPMSTYEVDLLKITPHDVVSDKHKKLLSNRDYEFTPITKADYPKLKPIILDIFNKGFDLNPYFVPISMDEFDFQAKDLIYFMDSSISFLAKHNGVPVGVSIHIPDINPLLRATKSRLSFGTFYHFIKCKLKRERTLCIFSAVLPEYQKQGILGAIVYHTVKAMKQRGYKKFGITWISETNAGSLRKMEDMKAVRLHDLRIFEKQIQ